MINKLPGSRGFLALLALFPMVIVLAWSAGTSSQAIPRGAVSSNAGWADESSCVDCHEQAEAFAQTGHAQTLRPATDPDSIALLEKLAGHQRLAEEDTRLTIADGRVLASTTSGTVTSEVALDWCFGSGEHACTWTSTLPDSAGATDLLEFRWSWYHGDVVDVTPGQPAQPGEGHFGKLGVLFDGPKAFRCFACHSNYLPAVEGSIDEAELIPGVTCQRCHGPRQAHVASDGEYTDPRWQSADRMDAIHRCAQCHRRADELEPDKIDPHSTAIVRFQPVGLVQSKCFTHSEMTCTTCHDPHLPASQQDMRNIQQCVQCHNPEHNQAEQGGQAEQAGQAEQGVHVLCAAGELDDCLRCHMPAVKMDAAPVHFTDHWIRVRDLDEMP